MLKNKIFYRLNHIHSHWQEGRFIFRGDLGGVGKAVELADGVQEMLDFKPKTPEINEGVVVEKAKEILNRINMAKGVLTLPTREKLISELSALQISAENLLEKSVVKNSTEFLTQKFFLINTFTQTMDNFADEQGLPSSGELIGGMVLAGLNEWRVNQEEFDKFWKRPKNLVQLLVRDKEWGVLHRFLNEVAKNPNSSKSWIPDFEGMNFSSAEKEAVKKPFVLLVSTIDSPTLILRSIFLAIIEKLTAEKGRYEYEDFCQDLKDPFSGNSRTARIDITGGKIIFSIAGKKILIHPNFSMESSFTALLIQNKIIKKSA